MLLDRHRRDVIAVGQGFLVLTRNEGLAVPMDRLTLDTNVIRDWAWCDGRSKETRYGNDQTILREIKKRFEALKSLRDQGRCELGITNQVFTDYEKDSDELPKHIDEMIGPHVGFALPSISTFPLIFPTVFVDENEINAIFQCVFPNSLPHHKRYRKNQKDALQLYAHRVAQRDYFITSDEQILAARDMLSNAWDIRAMTLAEYLSMSPSSEDASGGTG